MAARTEVGDKAVSNAGMKAGWWREQSEDGASCKDRESEVIFKLENIAKLPQ